MLNIIYLFILLWRKFAWMEKPSIIFYNDCHNNYADITIIVDKIKSQWEEFTIGQTSFTNVLSLLIWVLGWFLDYESKTFFAQRMKFDAISHFVWRVLPVKNIKYQYKDENVININHNIDIYMTKKNIRDLLWSTHFRRGVSNSLWTVIIAWLITSVAFIFHFLSSVWTNLNITHYFSTYNPIRLFNKFFFKLVQTKFNFVNKQAT